MFLGGSAWYAPSFLLYIKTIWSMTLFGGHFACESPLLPLILKTCVLRPFSTTEPSRVVSSGPSSAGHGSTMPAAMSASQVWHKMTIFQWNKVPFTSCLGSPNSLFNTINWGCTIQSAYSKGNLLFFLLDVFHLNFIPSGFSSRKLRPRWRWRCCGRSCC